MKIKTTQFGNMIEYLVKLAGKSDIWIGGCLMIASSSVIMKWICLEEAVVYAAWCIGSMIAMKECVR